MVTVVDSDPILHDFCASLRRSALPWQPVRHAGCLVPSERQCHVPLPRDVAVCFAEAMQTGGVLPTRACVRTYDFHPDDVGFRPLDVPHVDRSRRRATWGRRMRSTAILSVAGTGYATHFPDLGAEVAYVDGQLVAFSSCAPCMRHLGVRYVGATRSRTWIVLGWDGEGFDDHGHHEMLEHAPVEERASVFGRTVQEELVGMMGGPREGEALARLRGMAERRRVAVADLVREEEERAEERARARGRGSLAGLLASKLSFRAGKPDDDPRPERTYGSEACPVCEDEGDEVRVLRCGHSLCVDCFDAILRAPHLRDASDPWRCSIRCPQCRVACRSLFDRASVGGAGGGAGGAEEGAGKAESG